MASVYPTLVQFETLSTCAFAPSASGDIVVIWQTPLFVRAPMWLLPAACCLVARAPLRSESENSLPHISTSHGLINTFSPASGTESNPTNSNMAPKGGKGASSLSGMAQQKIIDDLKESITEQARAATFACGGSLPVKDAAGTDSETAHIDPIQIRFGENQQAQLVTLPADATESPAFQKLLAACTPASFGRGGNEVIDEDYRKASKLDPTAFLTSFCPYQAGIVDIISQLLLPNGTNAKDMRSVKAELYKLNVYSAPSGKFKPHVDTPRSDAQFASLVVALPVGHKGEQYMVVGT